MDVFRKKFSGTGWAMFIIIIMSVEHVFIYYYKFWNIKIKPSIENDFLNWRYKKSKQTAIGHKIFQIDA